MTARGDGWKHRALMAASAGYRQFVAEMVERDDDDEQSRAEAVEWCSSLADWMVTFESDIEAMGLRDADWFWGRWNHWNS